MLTSHAKVREIFMANLTNKIQKTLALNKKIMLQINSDNVEKREANARLRKAKQLDQQPR